MRRSGLLCLLLGLTFGPASSASAAFNVSVTASETQLDTNSYLYSYLVSNRASSSVAVSEFDISVNDPFGVTSLTAPGDFFTFYNPGDLSIAFYATDAGIAPGMSATFSFISSSAPGLVPDLVRGLDSSTFNNVDSPGMVIGAATAVPEPSSLVLCLLGASGLAARHRSRRRDRRPA